MRLRLQLRGSEAVGCERDGVRDRRDRREKREKRERRDRRERRERR